MTREEIYEHLASVYLGKRKAKKKRFSFLKILLFINLIAAVLLSSIYFIKNYRTIIIKQEKQDKSISLALNYYPLRLAYTFPKNTPQIKNFSLHLPNISVEDYDSLVFNIRGYKNGLPRILKVSLENKKKEKSAYYLNHITTKWQKITIPLSEFKEITDWSNLKKLSFIIEAWNIDNEKVYVLIDDICFYSKGGD